MCASMALSELPSRPTSVPGFSTSTRRERSPAAIAAAVFSTRVKGRKDRVTVQVAMKKASTSVEQPDADHHEDGVLHHGIHRVQGQPDHDDGARWLLSSDVDRHDPPVAAVGAADLERNLAGGSRASSARNGC